MRYLMPFIVLAFGPPALSAWPVEKVADASVATESQPGTTVAATIDDEKEDMGKGERKICRKIEVTGSRMNSKRICATANEWAAQKAQNRQAIEQAQNKKWSGSN